MSTDWTTNRNEKFGSNELYLYMSDVFAKILTPVKETRTGVNDGVLWKEFTTFGKIQLLDYYRDSFFNTYKEYGLCSR